MKAIILAGGSGTRLHPLTKGISKQLLPVYNKPMIYYPLSVILLANIKDILVIVKPGDLNQFEAFLGDGKEWGVNIQYAVQERPAGIAEAFIIGETFINGDPCALILGDNLIYKDGLIDLLAKSIADIHKEGGAHLFVQQVVDPERYGIAWFDTNYKLVRLEEKPKTPDSNWAVIGLYLYDSSVCEKARSVSPSARGELEITDINKLYLEEGTAKVHMLGRGSLWMDMGTHESLYDAATFVKTIEKQLGTKIADLEEISRNMRFRA